MRGTAPLAKGAGPLLDRSTDRRSTIRPHSDTEVDRPSRNHWGDAVDVAVPELPRGERVGVLEVCSVVAAASDQGGSPVQRGTAWLQRKLRVSRSTVQRYVKKAERAGVLEVARQRDPQRPGRHLANTYHPRPRPGSRCAELVAIRVARARGK